jgi:hypothetical protein
VKKAIIEDQLVYPGCYETQAANSKATPSAAPEITEEMNEKTTADLCSYGGLTGYESIE